MRIQQRAWLGDQLVKNNVAPVQDYKQMVLHKHNAGVKTPIQGGEPFVGVPIVFVQEF